MGTWAAGSFGNDSAGDWVMDLMENPTFDFIQQTLNTGLEDSYDSMNNENAVAAAEVLCILDGNIPGDYGEVEHNLGPAIEALKEQTQPAGLKALALQVITQIGQASELKEMWEDSEEWAAEIAGLQRRLQGDRG